MSAKVGLRPIERFSLDQIRHGRKNRRSKRHMRSTSLLEFDRLDLFAQLELAQPHACISAEPGLSNAGQRVKKHFLREAALIDHRIDGQRLIRIKPCLRLHEGSETPRGRRFGKAVDCVVHHHLLDAKAASTNLLVRTGAFLPSERIIVQGINRKPGLLLEILPTLAVVVLPKIVG